MCSTGCISALFYRQVLADISWGKPTPLVRQFLVNAYVQGAKTCGSAEYAELEGSTSVFAKRRYRDGTWRKSLVSTAVRESFVITSSQ
jgi:hypothetical protein